MFFIFSRILKVKKTKDPQTPGQLAKTFYTEALTGDPLNPMKLLELLSPTAMELIEGPRDETLMTAWNDAKDSISHTYGDEVQYFPINRIVEKSTLRVREKITLQSIALRFGPGLIDLIELDRKRSQSYVEDSASEDRTKMA